MDQLFQVSGEVVRPANTTAYAAGDVVGMNLTVTAASNASPIVITSASHGLATGDVVTVASVAGNTAANGNFKITKVDADTFSLDGSTGNGAYTSGGTVARWIRLANAGRQNGRGVINSVKLEKTSNVTTNAQFSVLVWRQNSSTGLPPSAQLDNAQLDSLFTNRADLVGETGTLTFATTTYTATEGCTVGSHNLGIHFTHVGGGRDLFVAPIAKAAYTPTSAETFRVTVGGTKD